MQGYTHACCERWYLMSVSYLINNKCEMKSISCVALKNAFYLKVPCGVLILIEMSDSHCLSLSEQEVNKD